MPFRRERGGWKLILMDRHDPKIRAAADAAARDD